MERKIRKSKTSQNVKNPAPQVFHSPTEKNKIVLGEASSIKNLNFNLTSSNSGKSEQSKISKDSLPSISRLKEAPSEIYGIKHSPSQGRSLKRKDHHTESKLHLTKQRSSQSFKGLPKIPQRQSQSVDQAKLIAQIKKNYRELDRANSVYAEELQNYIEVPSPEIMMKIANTEVEISKLKFERSELKLKVLSLNH
ncbi:unnamed protein product [Moneuplotes crassus]|uniref:Uncharacterized protein n=1 Tax=Euplotes crassus TaxID=5936 RepID=A0AAD2D609_EUPCR|nr:unnamed protein product [Moneuplotes crassus]